MTTLSEQEKEIILSATDKMATCGDYSEINNLIELQKSYSLTFKDILEVVDDIKATVTGTKSNISGWLFEFPLKQAVYLRTKFAIENFGTDAQLFDVSGAGNHIGQRVENLTDILRKTWSPVDIQVVSNNTITNISCKYNNHGWSKAGREILRFTETELKTYFCDQKSIRYAVVVPNVKQLNGSNPPDTKEIIRWDMVAINQCWAEVCDIFEKYDYDFARINLIGKQNRQSLSLMPHQKEAVQKALVSLEKDSRFLLAHKPRSGKTTTALYIAGKLQNKKVLLLTNYPILNKQWKAEIEKFEDFADYKFCDIRDGNNWFTDDDKLTIVACSLQYLKTNKEKERVKEDILKVDWDLVIYDEVHYGTETALTKELTNKIHASKVLGLSATPIKNLQYGTFNSKQTHFYDLYSETEYKKNNPAVYGKFPTINWFIYDPNELMKKELEWYYTQEENFTWTKFLEVDPNNNKVFKYHGPVRMFVKKFFGGLNGFHLSLRTAFDANNILAFLPTVASLEIFERILKEEVGDTFDITHTSADENSDPDKLYNLTQNNFNLNCKKVGIILAVDQLTTGITLPYCDTVLMLNDGESLQNYIQKAFRCQTPHGDKKDCRVIDFDAARILRIAVQQSSFLSDESGCGFNEGVEAMIKCAPIYTIYNGDFKLLELKEFLAQYYKLDFMRRNFELTKIIFDLRALDYKALTKWLKDIPFGSLKNQNKDEDGSKIGSLEKGKNSVSSSSATSSSNSTPAILSEENIKEVQAMIQAILLSLPWASLLTYFKCKSLNEIFQHFKNNPLDSEFFFKEIITNEKLTLDSFIALIGKSFDEFSEKRVNNALCSLSIAFDEDPKSVVHDLYRNQYLVKDHGEVLTPESLVREMLGKFPSDFWTRKDEKIIDPACGSGNFLIVAYQLFFDGLREVIPDSDERRKHILDNQLYGIDIQRKNVRFALLRLDPTCSSEKLQEHVICTDSLTFDYEKAGWKKIFNGAINPPYNDSSKGEGKLGSSPFWKKFVLLFFSRLLKDGGYLAAVHPSLWRQHEDELWTTLSNKKMSYLSIHSIKDGNKTFKAGTRYDWYCLQNSAGNDYLTTVRDQNGDVQDIDLKKKKFLLNVHGFESVFETNNVQRCKILHSYSMFEIRKDYMKKTTDDIFQYPCVYSVNVKDEPTLYYSSTQNPISKIKTHEKHFDVPKLIFGSGATGFLLDPTGKYGCTQFATAIVDDVKYLPLIKKSLTSEKFKAFIKATAMSKEEINRKMMSLLRKDFWLFFLPEDLTEEENAIVSDLKLHLDDYLKVPEETNITVDGTPDVKPTIKPSLRRGSGKIKGGISLGLLDT